MVNVPTELVEKVLLDLKSTLQEFWTRVQILAEVNFSK